MTQPLAAEAAPVLTVTKLPVVPVWTVTHSADAVAAILSIRRSADGGFIIKSEERGVERFSEASEIATPVLRSFDHALKYLEGRAPDVWPGATVRVAG